MTTYSRIILPLDESGVSEQAIPFARSLALSLSLPMTLVEAVEPDSPAITQSLNSGRRWMEPARQRHARAQEYLEVIAARLEEDGIRTDAATPNLEPASGIVDVASRDKDSLIVMASHGRTGIARWWMGSVADKVLQMANNPVLVIRASQGITPGAGRLPTRLVVPLDGSDMAELALPHVAYLAGRLRIPVTLLQATPTEEEYFRYAAAGAGISPPAAPSSPSISELVQSIKVETQGYLEDRVSLLKEQGVADLDVELAQGNPAEAIVDRVASDEGSIVVMTTHGRSGVSRMMLGSVAERVVRQSSCPVLLIRTQAEG